jgi:N utilization substance protein A
LKFQKIEGTWRGRFFKQFKGMTQGMLVVLGEKNIKKLKDFADLSSDELIGGVDEIKGRRIKMDGYLEDFALTREEADNLIMSARKIVYEN